MDIITTAVRIAQRLRAEAKLVSISDGMIYMFFINMCYGLVGYTLV